MDRTIHWRAELSRRSSARVALGVRPRARCARPTRTSALASAERKLAKLAKKTTALQVASLADSARHATWAERGRQPTFAASGDQIPFFSLDFA